MSLINEPSPVAFIDNMPLPKAEDSMTAVQKYWYNKGHEDGRNIALPIKTLTDAEIDEIAEKHTTYDGWDEVYDVDVNGFARAILRKAQEK